MQPVDFKHSNAVTSKPVELSDEDFIPIPIFAGNMVDDEGNEAPVILQCWQFTKEDLEEIQKTGRLWLGFRAEKREIPSTTLFTEYPFDDLDEICDGFKKAFGL